MIERIIKRNGDYEAYDPNKVNGWGEWASNNLPGVNWSAVVIEAVSRLKPITTSEELQNMLIEVCIERKTWNYQRMAGRLYASLIHKQVPERPLRELFQDLADKDLLDINFVSAFSDDEYKRIDDAIDYSNDHKMAYYQLLQFRTKYSLQDRITKTLYERPQHTMIRVAMCMLKDYNVVNTNRVDHIIQLYKYISSGKINVPTPYYVNAGTANNGYLSCCVYNTSDNADSLAAGDHIGYMMTVNSAGIGANVVTRSIGRPVRGGIIEHQGKLPYYRSLTSAVRANLQNGRGGAVTITYTCYDPEIETLLKLKNSMTPPDKAIREADYSFAFNAFFAERAAKNEPYYTFSQDKTPQLFELLYYGNSEYFVKEYERCVEAGLYESQLDARKILVTALTESVKTGRLYLFNIDEVNTHTPFDEPIHLSNLCLVGNTQITVIENGVEYVTTLHELNNRFNESTFKIKTSDVDGNVGFYDITASAMTGIVDELIEIECEGRVIQCTPQHKILTRNRGWVEAQHLHETDILILDSNV